MHFFIMASMSFIMRTLCNKEFSKRFRTSETNMFFNAISLTTTCVICEDIESHMNRYLYTFIHLWKTDTAFRKKWEASKGVCIPHAVELLRFSAKQLNAANQQLFAQSLLSLLKSNLAEDEKDLEWFTLKFDYRNQSKPWGNSRNALERTINRLRGECIVNDAKEKE